MSKNSFDFKDSDDEGEERKGLEFSTVTKPGLHDSVAPEHGRDLWEIPGYVPPKQPNIDLTRPRTGVAGDKSKTLTLGASQHIGTSQSKGNLKPISKAPVKMKKAQENLDDGFDPSIRKSTTNENQSKITNLKQPKQTKTIVKSDSSSSDDEQGVTVQSNLQQAKNDNTKKPVQKTKMESSSEDEGKSSDEEVKKEASQFKKPVITQKKTPSKVALKRQVISSDEDSSDEKKPDSPKEVEKNTKKFDETSEESSEEEPEHKPKPVTKFAKQDIYEKEYSDEKKSSKNQKENKKNNFANSLESSSEESKDAKEQSDEDSSEAKDKSDDESSDDEDNHAKMRTQKEMQRQKELEEKEREIELVKAQMVLMQEEKERELDKQQKESELKEKKLDEREREFNERKKKSKKEEQNFEFDQEEKSDDSNQNDNHSGDAQSEQNEYSPSKIDEMKQKMIEEAKQNENLVNNGEDEDDNYNDDDKYNPNDAQNMHVLIGKLSDLDLDDLSLFAVTPPPKGKIIQCTIVRDKSSVGKKLLPVYHQKLSAEDTYLMTAKKRGFNKTSNYVISSSPKEFDKKSPFCVGKLRSNFFGTEFNAYSKGKNPTKCKDANQWRSHFATIKYEKNFFGLKGPRKMHIYVPGVNADGDVVNIIPSNKKDSIYARWKKGQREGLGMLINKPPVWSEDYQAFVLNFYGRVKVASVKNFQLIDESKPEHIFLQFGKVSDHFFTCDFQYPITPAQAFMICLSSFDFKIACD